MTNGTLLTAISIIAFTMFGCAREKTAEPGDRPPSAGPSQVEFVASDGTKVYADLFPAEAGKDAPIIVLFHQARSNAAEYATIAPRLAKEGFNCLAVDLRSGGTAWQRKNRTAEQFKEDQIYESAYEDMVAALDWAKGQDYAKTIIWGSSYSASLAFKLASERDDVREVIAFSPGEYFDEKGIVAKWASKVSVPVFVSCAPSEVAQAESIYDAVATEEKSFNAPADTVHGSSALREDKNAQGAEAVWTAVLEFLTGIEEAPEEEPEPEPEPEG